MSRTFKIFFIVLGLGIFILPKQMIYAQSSTECCEQNSSKKECCKKEKTSSCHSTSSKNKSEKNNCGDDCNKCHSCSVHFVMNYLTPEFNSVLKPHFSDKKSNPDYSNPYFSFSFQNIWQPPKIS
jgi:hypothetical protein